jgi:zona occludens toxin
MIALVTGVPGSGKTFYTCRLIRESLLAGKFVATNIKLEEDWPERAIKGQLANLSARRRRAYIDRWRRRLVQVDSIGDLHRIRLGTAGWEKKLEGRGVAIFDEATEDLGARDWAREDRRAAMRFFEQHRKLGWDVYVIAQDAERVDKQLRTLAEYEVTLRNLKRYKPFLGIPIWPFGNLFLALWRWHGERGTRPFRKQLFTLNKTVAGMYDTHQVLHTVEGDGAELLWLPLQAAEPRASAGPRPDPEGPGAPGGPLDAAPQLAAGAPGDRGRLSNSRPPAKNGRSEYGKSRSPVLLVRPNRPEA